MWLSFTFNFTVVAAKFVLVSNDLVGLTNEIPEEGTWLTIKKTLQHFQLQDTG